MTILFRPRPLSLLRTYRHESHISLGFRLAFLKMRHILVLCSLGLSFATPAAPSSPFRLTLLAEPSTLDPQMLSSASGNYITTLIYRGLYRWESDQLKPDEGHCRWKNTTHLNCQIVQTARWSTGKPVVAEDYRRAFLFLLESQNGAPQAELLFSIKNAKSIYKGESKPSSLGFKIINSSEFQIEFTKPDAEFLFKLVHPALYPRHSSFKKRFKAHKNMVSNGPFVLAHVKVGPTYSLHRNPQFDLKSEDSLVKEVEALVVDSDNTALQLFESGKIQFLRRLPADQFSRYKGKPEFHQFPVLRFDYIGFGPKLKAYPQLRKALAQGFDPKGFQTLFETDGKPGCPSLPSSFYTGSQCYKKNKLPKSLPWSKVKPLTLGFSQMGGEDISRAAEWFQGNWKSHLQIQVQLQSQEQKTYIHLLKTRPPTLFRKGLSLDRPTCLAALEVFKDGHPENYIQFKNAAFEKILNELEKEQKEKRKKHLCSKGLELLIQEAYLIPLGEMKFTLLVSPRFFGWRVNALNQLDLRDLRLE